MDNTVNALEINNVSKAFKSFQVLNNISLNIKEGEIYGLLGPNGAGKTTLIRTIVGLINPDKGEIKINNIKVPNISILSHIGYMTQQPALYPDLTVYENLKFFASINKAEKNIDNVVSLVDLQSKKNELIMNLSGGMKQRCSLACALVHKPDLLFLDEPTVGIDPELRLQFWSYFRDLSYNGSTIIVSSHIMDEAEKCDRLGLIRDGHLITEGSSSEIILKAQTENLEDAFIKLSKSS